MLELTATTLLSLSLGVIGALLGLVALAFPRRPRAPAVLSLFAPPLVAFLWWYQSPTQSDGRSEESAPRADYRIELGEVWEVTALTDRGRRVHLGTLGRTVSSHDLSGVEDDHIRVHDLSRRVIVRTEPDPSHNCHGWVFTGGRYWVASEDVNVILSDNRYTRTATPAPGDLAVYRGAGRKIVHTGVVFSVAGCTLVESKWGPLGRYIHAPEHQPFGGVCEFYRSDRHGHLLDGLSPDVEATGSPRH